MLSATTSPIRSCWNQLLSPQTAFANNLFRVILLTRRFSQVEVVVERWWRILRQHGHSPPYSDLTYLSIWHLNRRPLHTLDGTKKVSRRRGRSRTKARLVPSRSRVSQINVYPYVRGVATCTYTRFFVQLGSYTSVTCCCLVYVPLVCAWRRVSAMYVNRVCVNNLSKPRYISA